MFCGLIINAGALSGVCEEGAVKIDCLWIYAMSLPDLEKRG